MELKKFIEEQIKNSPIKSFTLLERMIELEGIERYLNAIYGVELDIKVKPVERIEGRFYGKGLVESLYPHKGVMK